MNFYEEDVMKRIKLTQQADLVAFKQHFERRAGNQVSLEYLAASDVYAYRDGNGLKAGYVIHSGGRHRFFDLMAQIGFERIKPLPGAQQEFVEITCLWMEADARSFPLRLRFYSSCMFRTFTQRKRFIIGGTRIDAVQGMQQQCLPFTLFEGETENAIASGNWIIYYGTPWTFAKGFARQLLGETLKQLAGRAKPVASAASGRAIQE